MMIIDITGQTLGTWEVIKLHKIVTSNPLWECRCTKCGAIEIIPRDRLGKHSKRCDVCSSNIDVKAYTEYLKSRHYSPIKTYIDTINIVLDNIPLDQIISAYNTGNLESIVDVITHGKSQSTPREKLREIRVYCDYIRISGEITHAGIPV
jgi:hypothetical protein